MNKKQILNSQKSQVIEALKQDYFQMIAQLQRNWTPQQHEKNRLSRSLAAFAIANLADLTPAQAANSIINGENDNGIDAIYFDRMKKLLLLVQAKAGNAPNMGDNKKFCDGIRDLVHQRFQKFLDSNQERLRQECMVSNIVYEYRPSAERSQDAITLEQAAVALACFSGNTEIVVVAKREISQLYKHYYDILFSDGISGVTLCRYVRIFQYLDQIFSASEKAATNQQKKFYKHGRFFILDILARRNKLLLNKHEVYLSEDDKIELSRIGLEIAEIVYTVAESNFASDNKGYLAIFRNITDVKPLTSEVMQELDRRDAQAENPNIPTV